MKPFLERYPEEEADLPQVRRGRPAGDRRRHRRDAGRQHAGRRIVRAAGALRQGLFPQEAGRGRDRRLAAGYVRAPRADAAVVEAGRLQVVLVLPRRGATGHVPAEFLWEGIDGSRIPAFWLPHGYAHTYGSPQDLPAFAEFFKQRFDALAPFARGPGRVGLAGADVCEPEEHVPALVEQFNRQAGRAVRAATSPCPPISRPWWPSVPIGRSIGGELNPIFQGTYSSRIELKQRTRELERLLTTAEKLGVLLRWLGDTGRRRGPLAGLGADALQPGARPDVRRDDGPGLRRHDPRLRFLAADRRRRGPGRLARRLGADRHPGRGHPVAVFNALGWPRTDVAVANVGFSDTQRHGPEPGRTRRAGGAGATAQQRRVTPAAACCGPRSLSWPATFRRWDTPSTGLMPLQSPAAAPAAERSGRTGPRKRTLPPRVRPGRRRDHPAARQGRQLGSPARARQRRGPGGGPWRPVGTLPAAGRRQPHRHEDATRRARSRARASSATSRPDRGAR